jgi:hypothetical protein
MGFSLPGITSSSCTRARASLSGCRLYCHSRCCFSIVRTSLRCPCSSHSIYMIWLWSIYCAYSSLDSLSRTFRKTRRRQGASRSSRNHLAHFVCQSHFLMTNKAKSINLALWSKTQTRNKYLIQAVKEQQTKAAVTPASGSRELDLQTLRFIQHIVERGLTDIDDFSKNDIIDQFREAAIRYQLYGVIDVLSLYMTHYAPGFHGYVAQACRNSIEKSLTKRVLYCWKWER